MRLDETPEAIQGSDDKLRMINISNHPSTKWGDEQLKAAGAVVDLPFPAVDPNASSEELDALAQTYLEKIFSMGTLDGVVHVMGEMGFTFKLVSLLKEAGLTVVHSTTERLSVENPDGTKTSLFKFCQFREY